MKYKVGDKVKIVEDPDFDCSCIDDLKRLPSPYTGVIEKIIYNSVEKEQCYIIESLPWHFKEDYIEGLVKDLIPIYSRFELLDL